MFTNKVKNYTKKRKVHDKTHKITVTQQLNLKERSQLNA